MFGPFGKCEGPYLDVFCFVELVLLRSCLFAGSFGGSYRWIMDMLCLKFEPKTLKAYASQSTMLVQGLYKVQLYSLFNLNKLRL